jgi:hypothetical protein
MSIDVHLILCDAASNDANGKVHMLGAGWSITRTPTTPHAVVAMVGFPASEIPDDGSLPITLCLYGPDDQPVVARAGDAELTLRSEGILTVGNPLVDADVAADAPIKAVYSLSVAPLPLPPGQYRWSITVGDIEAEAPFYVLGEPAPAATEA